MSINTVKVLEGTTRVEDSATGTTIESRDTLGEVLTSKPMLNIGVSFSRTITTAPYENVKVQVSLNCPCELGEQDEVYTFVKDWCDDKLSSVINEIQGDIHG